MEHTTGAQGSPDTAPEGIFNATAGSVLNSKGGNCYFDASTCPLDDKMLASGGAYGEMSGKISVGKCIGLEKGE